MRSDLPARTPSDAGWPARVLTGVSSKVTGEILRYVPGLGLVPGGPGRGDSDGLKRASVASLPAQRFNAATGQCMPGRRPVPRPGNA